MHNAYIYAVEKVQNICTKFLKYALKIWRKKNKHYFKGSSYTTLMFIIVN